MKIYALQLPHFYSPYTDNIEVKSYTGPGSIVVENRKTLRTHDVVAFNMQFKQHFVKEFQSFRNFWSLDTTYLFSPRTLVLLKDIFLRDEHVIYELVEPEDKIHLYYVYPPAPTYSEPYPTYATIAAELPPDVHFFRKFADANYLLVTETFKQRWKEAGLKGATFLLKWDGKHAYPRV